MSNRRGLLNIAVQLIGFAAGIALLVWVGMQAFKPANREQLARIAEAGAGEITLLFALSLAVLILNGLIFWVILLPERRLRIPDVLAVNAIASTLAYLPFKLSVVARVAIHNRRDGVPLLTIAAWFGAVAVLIIAALGPVAGMSLWRGEVDAAWWVGSALGVAAAVGFALLLARALAHERGLARIHRAFDPLRIAPLDRFLRSDHFARLHAVFGMLAHPAAVWSATALRLADIAVQTARFMVAAAILDVALTWEQAVLVASTYFLIGLLSPFGMLGTREAGAVGLAELLGFSEAGESLVVVILTVSVSESLVNLAASAASITWLRPDRLLKKSVEVIRE